MTPQFFKGDDTEKKYFNSGDGILGELSIQKDTFFEQAFECFVLGEIIWDSGRSPLANAIPRAIFREAFSVIFNSFVFAGTFDSYILVFKQVFGDNVQVTFTVPAPGKLNIDIVAAGIQQSDFVARYIVGNVYFFDNVVDDLGNQIVFQTVKGLESEYELNQMLNELVPAGIYTTFSLTLGA